uniref:ABC transporter ATP-binding protein n=1 Tax=Panagrolaimus sp. ES5 TaxID=591445 RepID=A0AC34GDE1_9BILA
MVKHIFNNKFRHVLRAFLHSGPASGVPISGVGAKQPSGSEVIKKLLSYVWPKGNWRIKARVIVALSLLLAAKVLNVSVPFLLRDIINYYNGKAPETLQLGLNSPIQTIMTVGFALILAYGLARAGSALFNELRNAVFAKVAHHSVRSIAGMSFTLSALIFNVIPTAVEVSLVMTLF